MKKIVVITLALLGLLALAACNHQIQQGDSNMQYFFSGKIVEVEKEYLRIEVNDIGNTGLSEGATIEVSTDIEAADGCPDFVIGEYAKVLLAKNVTNDSLEQLKALSIYEVDETGTVVTE